MDLILNLAVDSIEKVWLTLLHNWPFLIVSLVIAALLKLYFDAERVSRFLQRYRGAGVAAATTLAVTTPLCSCGTTAIVLGMMASMMPWAPIVAFMVASPLTSPGELVYSAGLFGWPFALAFFLSSILLGLAGGWAAVVFERRGWLAGQARFADPGDTPCACPVESAQPASSNRVYSLEVPMIETAAACDCVQPAAVCGCAGVEAARDPGQIVYNGAGEGISLAGVKDPIALVGPVTGIWQFLGEMVRSGKRLLVMFVGFAFIGYFLNGLIPATWVAAVFGSGNAYSVFLAATFGLPFYINTEASLPLVRALLDAGMSQGAALAFMISGAGTSIGAMSGALTIARWRVIALVVGVLWLGAILSGWAYDLVLSLRLF